MTARGVGVSDQRVALAEIRGDVKLILAGQQRTHDDVQEIRRTLETHNQRLGTLETDKNRREGAIGGIFGTGKAIQIIASFVLGSGGVLAVLELMK